MTALWFSSFVLRTHKADNRIDQRGDGQRGGSDQTGVKGPSGNPQEGPVLPLHMLSKFQNKS